MRKTVFDGKIVAVTGKLQHYTRDQINNRLTLLGAKAASKVSGNTDFLIVGEKAGSKLIKARLLNVKTLTEEEFEALIVQ